jgi:hypothetical protein
MSNSQEKKAYKVKRQERKMREEKKKGYQGHIETIFNTSSTVRKISIKRFNYTLKEYQRRL